MVSENNEAVILSACRTAMGRFMGGIASKKAPELGAVVIEEAVRRAGVEASDVEEVIMGQVLQGGTGQAPARQAAIKAGIPPTVPAMTINKVCGSGLKAVMLLAQAIKAGDLACGVAGGMESMTNAPFYIFSEARKGFKFGPQQLADGMIHDGLWDSFSNSHMGNLAELIARKFNVTREDQDEFALGSHKKAVKAIKTGKFKDEIVPVEIPQRKGDPVVFDTDEGPREDTSIEALARLKPAFEKGGTVTAGNAPGLFDGASACVVSSAAFARAKGLKPIAKITSYASGGTEPEMLFYAPVIAVTNLLQKTNTTIDAYDLIEANEAFSAQALVDGRELGWDWDRVNVNGGAVALGHPIGASGARVLTTLLYALKDRNLKTGLATLCLGGGNAVALSVEMM
ncbi:MAG: acetyl-CoA C-acetyltransferase [Candidatus Glassbacteria bacterium]